MAFISSAGYFVSFALLILSVVLDPWMLWPLGGAVLCLSYLGVDDWWARKQQEWPDEEPMHHRTPNLWLPLLIGVGVFAALIYRVFDPTSWPSLIALVASGSLAYAVFCKGH